MAQEICIKIRLELILLKQIVIDMKKIILLILLSVFIIPAANARDVRVDGYYKSNGTYVEPHYRTSPNHTQSDNWGTKGNSNPWTGQSGTKSDDTFNNPWKLK